MRYQDSFIKTEKEAREFDSINATLLQKGGFVDQTMAGVYSFLPLGLRVLHKIETIVREEMNTVAAEMLMPALSPKDFWQTTGRLETIDVLFEAHGANKASQEKNSAAYILNPTHEDVLTPIAQRVKASYKDLPFAVYQIQSKFRNEPRPKSGLLRGREFRMKDLYSFHVNDEDRKEFYERMKEVYMTVFSRVGLADDTVIVQASGGDFTKEYSHEFQTKCETGEDTIFHDETDDTYYNKEVVPDALKDTESFKACEVGNIFPLGTRFAEAFGYTYTDEAGKQHPVFMASYGIGTSRIMGVLVEKFHDDAGIVWPASVAPYSVHLINLHPDDEAVREQGENVYTQLKQHSVEVIYDDRIGPGPGQKLAEADLLGIPLRVVVSQKTGDAVEIKKRSEKEVSIITVDELIKQVA